MLSIGSKSARPAPWLVNPHGREPWPGEDSERSPHVVIVGTIRGGMTVVGPFPNAYTAETWLAEDATDGDGERPHGVAVPVVGSVAGKPPKGRAYVAVVGSLVHGVHVAGLFWTKVGAARWIAARDPSQVRAVLPVERPETD